MKLLAFDIENEDSGKLITKVPVVEWIGTYRSTRGVLQTVAGLSAHIVASQSCSVASDLKK